jgi:seryl-tRNA synthetase
MIDVTMLRQEPERIRESQVRRGLDPSSVDDAVAADRDRRSAITEFERLRGEQKVLGREIGRASGDERAALLVRGRELADAVKAAEARQAQAVAAFDALVAQIPNVVLPDVPPGGEDDYVVLETVGAPRDFAAEGFEPRDHVDLGRMHQAIDIERGVKVSGARFYYLVGVGAQLELALIQLAMDTARSWGFVPMIPPALVRPSAMEGTGFLGQAADDVYHLERDDLYLVGTSEVPLAAFHSDEILDAGSLPLRYAAVSPCYRREAGTYGKDTRGIIRVHWFDKVEMFAFVPPDQAEAEHQRLLGYEKDWLTSLGLAYRVIDTAAGDLGLSAARKFDCEVWIPTQGRYRELTSASNCTEFQARRLNIRLRGNQGTGPVATLNGTLMAVTRTIVALLETHQQADGSVLVPEPLQRYLGTDRLVPTAT